MYPFLVGLILTILLPSLTKTILFELFFPIFCRTWSAMEEFRLKFREGQLCLDREIYKWERDLDYIPFFYRKDLDYIPKILCFLNTLGFPKTRERENFDFFYHVSTF